MPRRSRARAALALAATLAILPAAVQALPLGFEPRAAVLHLESGDWLARLGQAVRTLWTRAMAETGMSIDPDGRPDALPGGSPSDSDTGKTIDPDG